MKVPKATRLPSGNYNIRMRLNGENISITRATKTDARLEAERIKANYRNGLWTKEKKKPEETLGKIIDNYIDNKKTVLSPSTINGYRVIRRNRFKKYMGKKPSEIDNWQELIDSEVKANMNPKTVHNSWSLVASSLENAGIDIPRITLPPTIKASRPWLDSDQIKVFVKAIEGSPCEVEMLLCLHSLRRSEIFGLTWDKVDLKNGLIRVEGSVVQGDDGRQVYKRTNKTKNSRRIIPIMIPRLKELLSAVPKSKRVGRVYNKPQNYLWKEINEICEQNGLPKLGTHGLRHSYCSLAAHVGMTEAETMLLGGWEDIGTMRKIYQHISDTDLIRAKNKMADFYSSENFNPQNADENSETQ